MFCMDAWRAVGAGVVGLLSPSGAGLLQLCGDHIAAHARAL